VPRLRVQGLAKLYSYGLNGEMLRDRNLVGTPLNDHIYFNGLRITQREHGVGWFNYVADHLGSARVLVKAWQYTACYDADYLPYGTKKGYTNTCPQNYKFTRSTPRRGRSGQAGKERDTESGLDYFIARHYASNLAR
jgi:hypothetical protein